MERTQTDNNNIRRPFSNLKERLPKIHDAIHNIQRAFSLVWQAHPGSALVMGACTLVGALIPAAQAWVGKLIVDAVVNAIQTGMDPSAGLSTVLPYLAMEFGFFMVQAIVTQARSFAEHVLHSRINLHINSIIVQKALSLDLTHFENAEYYDKLQNARREADWRSLQIVNQGFYTIQNTITLVSFVILLSRFSPWLAILLFAATIPAFIAQSKYAELNFRVLSWRAPENRHLSYLEYILTDYHAVKEIKLFGLGDTLLRRYTSLFSKFLNEDQVIAQKRSLASLAWGLLATLTYYVAYVWIVWRALLGVITLGDMTLYLSISRSSQRMFESIFDGLSSLYENGLFLSNLFTFLALESKMILPEIPAKLPEELHQGIQFKGVSFKYEGSQEWALHDINLVIHPGEKVALVGPNGAGKTTLIKLLTRLYDPSEGQVLFEGVDIREYNLADLHQRIGVIFQDFAHYHLTAAENIGFGQVEALSDLPRIEGAARKSGAHQVIETLPEQYQTILGRWYSQGRDLSGGEWQKIALARAFMRDCEILILDEPTASLDAENEYRVFQQFRELTEDRMAVLISHRFSTVRMADRIYVLEAGRITEYGTHTELINLEGTYAKLFNLQADSYR